MRRLTALNCIAKRSVTYPDSISVSLCVCVCIWETETGWGDTQNILTHVHVTIQHRHGIANSHSHLLLGLRGLSFQQWHIVWVKHQFLVDSLGVDHALAHCYTGTISSFADFFGLSPPRNLFISRQWFGDYIESGQGLLMCTHSNILWPQFGLVASSAQCVPCRGIDALHQRCLLHTDPQHCLHILQPPSGCVFSMHPLLQARTSCHIASWRVLRTVLSKNGFYSGHTMLIVILHTLRQPFPCQLLLSKCWGPCDIWRKPPVIDTFFHKRHTQGKLLKSTMSWSPCRVRFRWRCLSEDRYTPIRLQVWKSLHKEWGTLLHPPSLVSYYPC